MAHFVRGDGRFNGLCCGACSSRGEFLSERASRSISHRWLVTRQRLTTVLLGCGLAIFAFSPPALAGTISFTLSSASLSGASGGDVLFQGTVTNNSGLDLNASELFFNFFGYDPLAVTPTQNLGVQTDFLILNGTTSGMVDLFDVLLGVVPDGASFPIQVQLEDINSDLSAIQTATVSIAAASPVPEPATLLLTVSGAAGLLLSRLRNRKRSNK